MQRTSTTSTLRRALTWLLVLVMVLSLLPTPPAQAVTGSTVAADGTYTSSGRVSFSKDNYTFDVTITVSGGKITNITSTLTSTPEESKSKTKYHPNAVSAILSKLQGKDATKDNIDGVSSGTPKYSYAALKTALSTAISNAPAAAAAQTYTVTWKSQDGNTTLETDSNVTSGTKPSYDGNTPTKDNTSTTIYNFAGWSTSKNQTSGTAASNLPAVTANVTYYAAFSETAVQQGSYNITWCNWDGSEIKTTSVKGGDKPVFGDPNPSKPGDTEGEYTFVGWATSSQQSSGVQESSLPAASANTTYYAAFAQASSSVSPRTITIADGTYVNASADVTTRDYTYNPVTTIVVSGGKITSFTSDMLSDNAINQLRHKRATTEVSSKLVGQSVTNVDTLLQLLSDLNPDSDSSESLADAVSGATLSTYALLNETKAALCGTLVNPSASAKTKNPTKVTSNGITLDKQLAYNGNGTYTLTLKAYAEQGDVTVVPGGTTTNWVDTEMWSITTGQDYTYTTLINGKYYYSDGTHAYLLQGKKISSKYYVYYENEEGTTYYLTSTGTSTTSTSSARGGSSTSSKIFSGYNNNTIFTTVKPAATGGTTEHYDSYTGTLTYQEVVNNPDTYYYLENGTYYVLQGYNKSSKYYINAYNGSKYNGLKKDGTWKGEWKSDKDKGDDVKSTTTTFTIKSSTSVYKKTTTIVDPVEPESVWRKVANGTITLPGQTIPGGTTKLGADAALRDFVNLISWDASRATVSAETRSISMSSSGTVTEGSATANSLNVNDSMLLEDGTIEVTGFDYKNTAVTKGGSGQELVLTIANLLPTRAGDYVASNALDVYGQNAGVFDGMTLVSDIVSPMAKVEAYDVDYVFSSDATVSNKNFYGTVTIEPGVTVTFTGCEFYDHVYNEGTANFAKNDHFYAGMTTTGTSTVTQGEVYEYGTGSYVYPYGEDNAYFFNSLLNDDKGVTHLTNVDYYVTENDCYTVSSNALADGQSGVAYSQDFNAISYDDGVGTDVYISAEPYNLVPDGVSAATNKSGSRLTVEGTPNTVGDGLSFTLKLGREDDNDTVIYYIPVNINIKDRAAVPVDATNNNEIRHVTEQATSDKDGGLYLNKTLTERKDGLYDLTLEAYTTGAVFSESYTAPADIVLVLDQSTSMTSNNLGNITRLQALKNAANDFISKIQQNAAQTGMDHRIAVVGFSADYSSTYKNYPGTEILSTESEVNYEDATRADYAAALVDANVNNAVNSRLTTAITRVQAVAQTYDNFGMTMTKNILQNRSVTTFQKDGKTMDRRTVVIFFTDGCPGKPAGTFFWEGYDSISVANETILRAAELKNAGTAIYSVGVFEGAGSTAATNFSRSSYTISGYGTHDQLVPAANAANAFMHFISSDYPTARSMEQPGVAAPEMYDAEGNYTGYYYTASNLNALYESFNDISVEVTRPILELKNTAVLFDELTDNFETTADTVVTAAAHPVYGYENGEYQFYNQASQTLNAQMNGKIITVTGYDYDANYLYKDGNGVYHGQKIVVKIPALLPTVSGQNLDSNTARSGIYADQSDIDEGRPAVGYFPKPNTDIPHYTRIADFDVNGTVVATNVERMRDAVEQDDGSFILQGKNGTFTLKDGTVTYTMQRDLHQFGTNIDLTVSGVDTAYVYGKHNNATGEEFGYREGYAKWQQINVVPGTSIYFDDSYQTMDTGFATSGTTDLDDAYQNAAINAASVDAAAVGAGRLQFLFSGTRIDVYCTTETTSGSVQAILIRGSDLSGERIKSFVMNNKAETTRCNIPTLSLDVTELDDQYTEGQQYLLVIITSANAKYKLDAVRVYNPISQDTKFVDEKGVEKTVGEVYTDAKEQNAVFTQVRKILLNEETEVDTSALFASGDTIEGTLYFEQGSKLADSSTIKKYEILGPKNEVYLKSGDSVAFQIRNLPSNGKVMVGVSAPEVDENGVVKTGKVQVSWGDKTTNHNINTVVDQFYDVTPNGNGQIVIKNTGANLISITNVKITGDLVTRTVTPSVPDGQASADATVLSVAAEADEIAEVETLHPQLVVSQSLLAYVETFDTLEVVDLSAQPSPEPTESPDPGAGLAQLIHELVSRFVKALFESVSRLFGN